MEVSLEANKALQVESKNKGGIRTMPFIIANEAFEKVASFGLLPNMIFYLMKEYKMDVATGTSVLTLWGAASNFLPILGAFVSDSYLGRYRTIVLGSFSSLLGMTLLWLTTMIPHARPPNCDPFTESCKSATSSQLALLFSSFVLMSIGAGGIRPCSLAFGADQFDKKDNPNNERVLQSFFNWYYASAAGAAMVAMTIIVYIQDHLGWKVGFGIPALLMLLSALMFLLATPWYINVSANKSLFVGFAQVCVVAFKNRHLALPPNNTAQGEACYHHNKGSKLIVPTEKLRFLNKACIIQNPEDLNPDGSASNPWNLCTVQQVEELKSLLKVLPIWSTGIAIAVNLNQPSFPIVQTNSMDRHLTSNFKIPAGSFSMFTILTIMIWIAIYDRLIIPLLAKVTGRPQGLTLKQRMGIGLVLSTIATAVGAIVETVRRRRAIEQGFANNPQGMVNMSAMWLIPHLCIGGLAEAFNAVGQTEFYYSEFPKSMSSIASCLFGLTMAVANLIVNLLVRIVDNVTKKGGKVSWVSSNLNKGHYNYYLWILVVISCVNFVYFLVCCWAYGPCERDKPRVSDGEEEEMKEEELSKSRELPMITAT